MKTVVIIGGGASGMMAALSAAEDPENRIILLERQQRIGRKLLATGNGRCNLTNVGAAPENYHGESTASAIRLYVGFLFAGNRGDDSIAMYEIQKDGTLTLCCIKKTGGRTPRDFQIFSDYLVAANQDSDSLTVLHINRKEKRLERTAIRAEALRPTCICKTER